MAEPNEFSWSNSKTVVVKRVDPIAAYLNDNGDLVIRQQASAPRQEDAVVVVPISHAWTVIEALTRQVKRPSPAEDQSSVFR